MFGPADGSDNPKRQSSLGRCQTRNIVTGAAASSVSLLALTSTHQGRRSPTQKLRRRSERQFFKSRESGQKTSDNVATPAADLPWKPCRLAPIVPRASIFRSKTFARDLALRGRRVHRL